MFFFHCFFCVEGYDQRRSGSKGKGRQEEEEEEEDSGGWGCRYIMLRYVERNGAVIAYTPYSK